MEEPLGDIYSKIKVEKKRNKHGYVLPNILSPSQKGEIISISQDFDTNSMDSQTTLKYNDFEIINRNKAVLMKLNKGGRNGMNQLKVGKTSPNSKSRRYLNNSMMDQQPKRPPHHIPGSKSSSLERGSNPKGGINSRNRPSRDYSSLGGSFLDGHNIQPIKEKTNRFR
jgi:hypothetical protein